MNKDVRPERQETDAGLALERAQTDQALIEKAAELEAKADVVLGRAREKADDVLSTARLRADETLRKAGGPAGPETTDSVVLAERAREDDVVRKERARADDAVRVARAASLARLFPMERDKTDLSLLTERARSDDALAQRDDFLGMVSHDLRDLLSGIVLSAGLIAEGADPHDEHGKRALLGAQRIQRYSTRMVRLIGDLVDVASIDAGKLAVVPLPANASDVVVDAVDTWQAVALGKGMALVAGELDPVTASIDHDRVLQVLGNLITNAVKFSASGDRIVVSVVAGAEDATFAVVDSGQGVAADQLDMIFERFWQVGKSDRRGLGLGLYISKCIVEAHGGLLWAESKLGEGSTFLFTVPRHG